MSNLEARKSAKITGQSMLEDDGGIPADDLFWKAAHAAKLFCIASAMIIPNLLIIHVLL